MEKIDMSIPFVWVTISKELRPSRKGEQKASRPLQKTIAYLQTILISETEKGASRPQLLQVFAETNVNPSYSWIMLTSN